MILAGLSTCSPPSISKVLFRVIYPTLPLSKCHGGQVARQKNEAKLRDLHLIHSRNLLKFEIHPPCTFLSTVHCFRQRSRFSSGSIPSIEESREGDWGGLGWRGTGSFNAQQAEAGLTVECHVIRGVKGRSEMMK